MLGYKHNRFPIEGTAAREIIETARRMATGEPSQEEKKQIELQKERLNSISAVWEK